MARADRRRPAPDAGPGREHGSTRIAVLAAGRARRFGRLKQLEPLDGEPMVRRVARAALASDVGPVHVMLGADAEAVALALRGLPLRCVRAEGWQTGMGGTIACAAREASADPSCDQLLLVAGDQPDIPADVLRAIAAGCRNAGAAAAGYGGTAGIPACFARAHFAALTALSGDRGARRLLLDLGSGLATVACPEAGWDLDTPGDLRRWRRS